ncbi:hypothetical protein NL511_31210, partial [Klebsiella pneumoniae]|nr:hypothetical protein [Klebsiella pneumoniae]
EVEFLSRGQIPSIFFRFPGLISDQPCIENLARHSLIAVGSDAWLALGQSPKSGSIILVHANGNEPQGIHRFFHSLSSIEA